MQYILTGGDVARRFSVPYRKLSYLFECGKLDVAEFDTLGGRRIFKKSDLSKIEKALATIKKKGSAPVHFPKGGNGEINMEALRIKIKNLQTQTDLRIWTYFLQKVELDTKLNCKLCGGPGTFRIAQNAIDLDPRSLLGSCQDMACGFRGNSELFVQRFTGLPQARVRKIIAMFNSKRTNAEITETINEEADAHAAELRRTFQT